MAQNTLQSLLQPKKTEAWCWGGGGVGWPWFPAALVRYGSQVGHISCPRAHALALTGNHEFREPTLGKHGGLNPGTHMAQGQGKTSQDLTDALSTRHKPRNTGEEGISTECVH